MERCRVWGRTLISARWARFMVYGDPPKKLGLPLTSFFFLRFVNRSFSIFFLTGHDFLFGLKAQAGFFGLVSSWLNGSKTIWVTIYIFLQSYSWCYATIAICLTGAEMNGWVCLIAYKPGKPFYRGLSDWDPAVRFTTFIPLDIAHHLLLKIGCSMSMRTASFAIIHYPGSHEIPAAGAYTIYKCNASHLSAVTSVMTFSSLSETFGYSHWAMYNQTLFGRRAVIRNPPQ